MNDKQIEILSPAGNLKSLKYGIYALSDSVYFGMSNFNARRNADNFDTFEKIKEAVDFCHLRNKKAYLTFNTTIYDNEIDLAIKDLTLALKAKFDAVIIQDLGILKILKEISNIKVHASTQLSAHSLSDVKALEKLGFDRVVLARELTLDEIKNITDNTNIETEVFVHGALCMSVSGQCYFSSALGQRSANRGLCAGVCRLPFYYKDKNNYSLSLKDVSNIKLINELKKLGVTSIKIEGRMKNEAYVYNTVSEIRSYLGNGYYDEDLLKNTFSRNGFTDGYLKNKIDTSMFGIRDDESKQKTKEEERKFLSKNIKEKGKIKIDIDFNFKLNKEAKLKLIDEDFNEVSVSSLDILTKADKKSLTKEDVIKNLTKLGQTPYYPGNISFTLDENLFYPISKINALRREAINKLDELRLSKYKEYNIKKFNKLKNNQKEASTLTKKRIGIFNNIEVLDEEIIKSFDMLFIPLFEVNKLSKDILKYKNKLGVNLPRIYFDDEKIISSLKNARELGINNALAHTIGRLNILEELNFLSYISFSMNVNNSYALNCLLDNFKNIKLITASFENKLSNINKLKCIKPLGVIVYGYMPLMITRNCPLGVERNCNNKNCFIIDRKNTCFNIVCHNKETFEVLNSTPIYLGDKQDKIKEDISFIYIFENETKKNILNILNNFKNNKNLNNITRASYFKSLE